jgi:flagellar protein FlaG
MESNVSQVGQYLAPETTKNDRATQDVVRGSQQQTKDLSISAEINKQNVVEVSAEQIETAVSQLTEILQTNNRQLSFSVDEGSNKQVVKVTDAVTGEVIRQIPSEEVLKLSERLQDLQLDVGTAAGLLFNKQV